MRDGVWDWEQMYICRRINNFEREWLGEERVNSQCSAATSTKPKAKGGGRGEGRGGKGCLEKESTFETFSKSHPQKGSSLP